MTLSKELRVATVKGIAKYRAETPERVKLLDLFALFLFVVGITQLGYCLLVGSFPFNSFLAGFIAAMGTCSLTVCFRTQITCPEHFKLSTERMFADYLVANMALHVFCICFLG